MLRGPPPTYRAWSAEQHAFQAFPVWFTDMPPQGCHHRRPNHARELVLPRVRHETRLRNPPVLAIERLLGSVVSCVVSVLRDFEFLRQARLQEFALRTRESPHVGGGPSARGGRPGCLVRAPPADQGTCTVGTPVARTDVSCDDSGQAECAVAYTRPPGPRAIRNVCGRSRSSRRPIAKKV